MSSGFDPAQFWGLTPKLLSLHLAGSVERLAREHNERMSLAWHMASLNAFAHHQPKKMPKLDALLAHQPKTSRSQTADEQIAALKQIMSNRRG